MSQCTRRGPKTRGQCSKFGYCEHEEHHSLETGEKWTDRDYNNAVLRDRARSFEEHPPKPIPSPPGRPIVVIESPYAGDVERNLAYVRAAMRDCPANPSIARWPMSGGPSRSCTTGWMR